MSSAGAKDHAAVQHARSPRRGPALVMRLIDHAPLEDLALQRVQSNR